jgi:hypothetical protein
MLMLHAVFDIVEEENHRPTREVSGISGRDAPAYIAYGPTLGAATVGAPSQPPPRAWNTAT